MANLDIFLEDNGRVSYSKDLSLTQYSTTNKIRLLTKNPYYVVNMNVTTGTGLNTYLKNLILEVNQYNGYYVYSYTLGLDITGYEFAGDKSILKIAFYLYPNDNDLNTVTTTSIVYLPLLASLSNRPSNLSGMSPSELAALQATVNSIQATLSNLELGEIDTAKNYDLENGNIQAKFSELASLIQNNSVDIGHLEQILGAMDIDSDISTSLAGLITSVSALQSGLSTTNTQVSSNTSAITNITENILPTLQAGVKYQIVSSLPSEPANGVVYLVNIDQDKESNVYTEYMYINGAWEILGTSQSEVDLDGYATENYVDSAISNIDIPTKTSDLTNDGSDGTHPFLTQHQSLANYALKSEIPTKVSELTNDSNYVTSSGLSTTLTNYATNSSVSSVESGLQSQITSNDTDISNLQTRATNIETNLSNVSSTASAALALAGQKSFAKVFASKADMITYIQSQQTDPIAIGTQLFITAEDVPDYWVSAIYTTATNYTTTVGASDTNGVSHTETFNNVYYGVEPIESKVDLSGYYTKTESDNKFETITNVSSGLALKENLSNKVTSIGSSANNTNYPTEKAVKDYVDAEIDTLEQAVDNTYATKTALAGAISDFEDGTRTAKKAERDASGNVITSTYETKSDATSKLNAAKSYTDDLEDDIEDGTVVAKKAEKDASGNTITSTYETKTDATSKLNTAESYTDTEVTKIKDGTYTAFKATRLVDYDDSTKTIRLTTSDTSAVNDYEISDTELEDLQSLMSMLGANEYNS